MSMLLRLVGALVMAELSVAAAAMVWLPAWMLRWRVVDTFVFLPFLDKP